MISKISPQEAAKAAKDILGIYPEIPASDPKAFAAALVQTLLIFPRPVIDRAVDPVLGIPGKVTFLNLAAIRKLLDEWMDEYVQDQRRLELKNRKRLAASEPDPAADARIAKGLEDLVAHLKSGFDGDSRSKSQTQLNHASNKR
jgi:hypothetical protein